MEVHNFGSVHRSISTRSTASTWTESTLAGMGISLGHATSSSTIANAEDNMEDIPLQTLQATDQGSYICSNDSVHNNAQQEDQGQENLGNQDESHRNNATPSNPQSSLVESPRLISIWWTEIITCLLVVAMLAALIGTVSPYQGRPLPQWPYSLSINTIVAFYAEVMRAAMIFIVGGCLSQLKWNWFMQPRPLDHIEHYDNASRGPWGSVELLWAIRLRALLPSLGGVLMILSLLLVPFTQQIVQFYSCTILDGTLNASIPKTNFASAGLSLHIGANLNSIQAGVQAVMNSGVYDDEPKRVSFVCPNGTCTFETVYHSMGWCSHCEDISDQVESHTSNIASTYTLPESNLSATTGPRTFVMGQKGPSSAVQAILGLGSSKGSGKLPDTPWGNRGYGAAECSIKPCVRSYTSTIKSGNLTETPVSTSEIWSPGQYWLNSIDVSCLNDAETQALHDAGYDFDPRKTVWLGYNLSALAEEALNPTVLNATNTTIRPECIYQTYQGQVDSLSAYLGVMFTGAVGFGPGALAGPSILQTIFQEGNVTFATVDDAFDRLAQALTVWNREQGGNVMGQAYRSDTCVSARWGWLAYPLSLVVGTVVLLAWTIDCTRKEEGSAQDYKSSPLALFFHRLGHVGSEGPASGIETKDGLQNKAKTMKVVFQGTNKIWRFIEVD